ncbi:adenylate kinase [Streptacidiphilus melanogenes]|uniref:adenylate kinase n=1 Tax=Streptacidiphilus melanogenes TaxID=411235 RepID=UPI0005A67B69|nr:adenylate kinase [Streptacidiphilus melanogenes]
MRLVFIGPPGAGKGTQAAMLSSALGVPHISTGDLFRRHRERRTPLGRDAERYLDAGELVPDSVTVDMVRMRLDEPDARHGFILDGFPRTVPQADGLTLLLDGSGVKLDAVVEFTAPEDVLVDRLLARGRQDDAEDVIRNRQRVYHRDTAPVLAYYADLLVSVDAVGGAEQIADEVLTRLQAEPQAGRHQRHRGN